MTLRALRAGDGARLTDLIVEVEAADGTEAHLDADDVARRLADPNVDLAGGSVAIEVAGCLVGYGLLRMPRATATEFTVRAEGAVHPNWRRRGIGRLILDELAARAAALASAQYPDLPGVLHVFCHGGNAGKVALLRAAGFREGTGWLDLQRPLGGQHPDIPVPAGLRLAGYRDELDEAIRLVHNETFARHWGSPPADPTSWRQSYTGSRAFRPELSFVLLDGERVAGYLLGYEWVACTRASGVREAWLGQVGTLPRYRLQSAGGALLAHAVRAAHLAGFARAGLRIHADRGHRARALEREAGFVATHRWTSYVRPLQCSSSDS